MTQTVEIIWAGVAEHDLKDIVACSAADSPANALKITKDQTKSFKSFYLS